MGLLRNGAIPVEYQVAMTLRWLAGGSIYECMDGHVIARSTAYHVTSTVINALNACPELNCKWPEGEDAAGAAELFRNRSSYGCRPEVRGSHGWLVCPDDQAEREGGRRAQLMLQRAQERLRHELPGVYVQIHV
ncbi:unnamed protein product [Ectocarpus sp. CCAP 1310/34]|nr:unnamed protein product [Ectocarpus sp. CCAP 1310/34]